MRRIYESGALRRDDENPYHPNERVERPTPTAMRSVPSAYFSKILLPHWLRYRGLSVSIDTQFSTYEVGGTVPFLITLRNTFPFPITVKTRSPLLWSWAVNGVDQASYVAADVPDEPGEFTFSRGERKQFHRKWSQTFQITKSKWESADSGQYTLSVALNVDEPKRHGLYADTQIQLQ